MAKILKISVILLGILIAQVLCSKPPETRQASKPVINRSEVDVDNSGVQKTKLEDDDGIDNQKEEKSTDEDEEIEEATDDEDEDSASSLPFLTCTLFQGNFACDAMCSIFGSMYGIPITSGVCEERLECECEVSPDSTLEDYWNAKFLAKNTLRDILRDDELSKKVFKVIKSPFKTPPQVIEDLTPLLSPKQLSSLRFKNKSAQKIFPTANDGEFDKAAIQKYVANKLKSLGNPPEGSDYKKTLLAVLDNPYNKDLVDYIIYEIRQSKNKLLNGFIDGYIKERGLQIQSLVDASNGLEHIVDILDIVVINNLIKQLPRENVLKLSGKRSKPKKSAAGIPADPTKTGNESSSDAKSKSSNKPESELKPTVIDDSRWILEKFDTSLVDQIKKGSKCWLDPDFYRVCVYKRVSSVRLIWWNKRDNVHMQVFYNDRIEQDWTFREPENLDYFLQFDVTIRKYLKTGAQTELWRFPETSLKITKSAIGEIQKVWSGKEDLQTLEKYKNFVKAWCTHNDFYVGKENCVITLI